MTIAQALVVASRALQPVSDTARLDAELLMAHALGVTRSELILRHMHAEVPNGFAALVERRGAHEPVAYITGHQEFWGLDLRVDRAVLIPRGDSETLIAVATERLRHTPPARVIDLGTGSGALLCASLDHWPQAQGLGIDRSEAALAVARANAERLGLAARARLVAVDWTVPGWHAPLGRFDLVLANPPYVESTATLDPAVAGWEPAGALYAGADGLDDYRRIVPCLPDLLTPGGIALIEIGHSQATAVCALAQHAGLVPSVHTDLAGRDRAIALARA